MSQNVVAMPPELYQSDLPRGFQCEVYIGRMVGRLGPVPTSPTYQQFNFEIHAADDPTETVLSYVTYGAPAAELARWENVGDTVGIVMEHKDRQMAMVLAYNFTRRKWFATGYYPHSKDHGLESKMSVDEIRTYMTVSTIGILLCGLGLIGLVVCMYLSMAKSARYKVLNPSGYRGVTAVKIANWITANSERMLRGGNPALDPSL